MLKLWNDCIMQWKENVHVFGQAVTCIFITMKHQCIHWTLCSNFSQHTMSYSFASLPMSQRCLLDTFGRLQNWKCRSKDTDSTTKSRLEIIQGVHQSPWNMGSRTASGSRNINGSAIGIILKDATAWWRKLPPERRNTRRSDTFGTDRVYNTRNLYSLYKSITN